jgi:hypothetical protein
MVAIDIWGPHFWFLFHCVALGYPKFPTLQDQQNYKAFYISFGHVLPCKKCAINYENHLVEFPIDMYLMNEDRLFEWTVKIHNIVNRENGKPEYTVQQARNYYLSSSKKDTNNSYTTTAVLIVLILLSVCISVIWWKKKHH